MGERSWPLGGNVASKCEMLKFHFDNAYCQIMSVWVSMVTDMVVGSGHSAAAAADAGSNIPPLPSNVAARMTNQSLSSYYGAVAAYSGKLSRPRPVSAAVYKSSFTGLLDNVS